jgi:zinc protease
VSLETLEDDIKNEIRDVIENGVSDTEISEAIQRLQDGADYARDSLSGPAMTIGYAITTGSSLDDVENWPENIAKITAADVQRVADTYLNDDKPWHRPAIISHYLPIEEVPEAETNEAEATE